ncbi:alanine racemase [Dethiothermospora halolimnae]|uniref:alanine racemase n=1 Tax=Dethiothermospora halolimnae TaxID=3114390 RepID=UPI003CCC08B9
MGKLDKVRPVWAEINLDNLAHNIKEVRRVIDKGAMVTAVVKADGYGHGATTIAKTFLENGGDRLAVATLSEAIELRKSGIKAPILLLGYNPDSQVKEAIEYDITQTIYTYEQAKSISIEGEKQNKAAKIHIKVDTGMSRLGFLPEKESIKDIERIFSLPNLEIEGIFTHFAVADEKDKTETKEQYKKYSWIINELEKLEINIPIKHVANSATVIDIPEYSLDMVRAGIMLYGLYPSVEVNKEKVKLKPAMTLKARISNVKTLPKGKGISYGHIYKTNKETKVGTIPIGYADGFTRMLTGKGEVGIKGKRAEVIGRICMDQCMIDITDIDNVNIGDEVILFGDGTNNSPHIDEIADKLNTINYEIVCMVNRRVPRVYIKNQEIVKTKDYLLG